MADKKISELVSLAGKDVAATDLFPVVDVSVAETKSLTRDELRNAVNAIQFAATKALATTAAASLPDDTIIEVAADESLSYARTRYTVAAGALVFAYGVATQAELDAVADAASTNSNLAYIEQFLTGFFGRGMLAGETINIVTEQDIVVGGAKDATQITVTDATNFLVGGSVTLKHDNGIYGTYHVAAKSTNLLTIYPYLRSAVTAGARIERTWLNRAHPGKFYMRELAQRIANSAELDTAVTNGGRIIYTAFGDAAKYEDKLIPLGGATINYYAAANTGVSGTSSTPPRFACGRTAYFATGTIGYGAETAAFAAPDGDYVADVALYATSFTAEYKIEVVDQAGAIVLASFVVPAAARGVTQVYAVPFSARGTNLVKLRVVCTASAGGAIALGRIDVFAAPKVAGNIISKPSGKIVVLGDSWVAGDLGSTPEREPMTQQLALELPAATIVNAGVGGNKIWQELARFDTDVAPHNPDYVVVSTGTNECYNPASGIFEPNSTDYFVAQFRLLIQKIQSIGARPIIIGVPALAESDAATAYVGWELNDRARTYNRVVTDSLGTAPLALGGKSGNNIRRLDLTITSGATPSVKNAARVELTYASPTTVTNLLDGVDGQIVTLIATNGNVTLSTGYFQLAGGGEVNLTTNSSITFIRKDPFASNSWIELSRSIAGAASAELSITSGATPSVAGAFRVLLDYAALQDITNFTGGTSFQEIQVRAANGNVTLKQGTLKLTGGVDITLTADSVITFLKMDVALSSRWVEVSRSIK